MENENLLLKNIDNIHTTPMGIMRIARNLNLTNQDVVLWCKEKICDKNCKIYLQGKNWYAKTENYIITINASSYTIITAHKSIK